MQHDQASVAVDPLAQFKRMQREGWANFAPLAALTAAPVARLVKHAKVQAEQRVLDVACGTGVVAITAARRGAKVTGLDLTPELLERARENAQIAGLDVEWHEGDVEELPFADRWKHSRRTTSRTTSSIRITCLPARSAFNGRPPTSASADGFFVAFGPLARSLATTAATG